jgi:hypothetical protein
LRFAQKQVSREEVIGDLAVDVDRIARERGFAIGCSGRQSLRGHVLAIKRRAGRSDESLEEKGIRLDTLKKGLKSDVARERLARMQSHDHEDRLDHPLIPKM